MQIPANSDKANQVKLSIDNAADQTSDMKNKLDSSCTCQRKQRPNASVR